MQAQEVAVEAKKANGKGQPVLMPERCGLSEQKRHDWVVDVEAGIGLEQVMDDAYWAHVAKDMVAGDHIEVRAEDGAWVADLYVRFAERTYVKVALKSVLKFESELDAPAVSIKHEVKWKGPHYKFVVIRISDSKQLQANFNTRSEAEDWIRNHEKGMAK